LFGYLPKDAFDFINKLLCLDPNKRLTSSEALKHDFFNNDIATPDELISALF
jgi:serine/threonine protein kinase